MMYEELLKALRCCAAIDCGECGYNPRGIPNGEYCTDKLMIDAADVIEKLSKELMDLKMLTCCCCEPPKEKT